MSKNISTLLFVGILTLGCIGGEAVYAEEIEPAGDAATVSETTEVAPEAANGLGAVDEAGIAPMAEDASQPTTGGVTSDPAEARDQATYDAALKSIENLNKKEALKAGIDAVDAQVKGFSVWVDIPFGINEVEGNLIGGLFGVTTPWDFEGGGTGSIKMGLYCSLNNIDDSGCTMDLTINDSFKTLIDKAMADSRYGTDQKFKEMVDYDAQVYSYGRTILEQTIPKLNPSYTEYVLKSKTDAELVKIAQELPETVAYTKSFKFNVFEGTNPDWSLYRAYFDARSNSTHETPDETLAKYYAILVTAATRIDPEFKVDLSGVTSLVVKEETTKAPNSGSLFSDGDNSATIVTVALGAVAGLAGAAGLAYVIKRYLFSPLKRRH